MKNIPAIFTREIKSYFFSPVAYVALIVFAILSGFFFERYFNIASRYQYEATMRIVIHNMSITMLLVVPLMTMRLLAEEKNSGTMEILMTSPVTDAEVVIGKFAASLALFTLMLILTFTGPLFFIIYSAGNLDTVPMFVGYLGLFLLGTACLSLGMVTSALTKNQIVAALVSFAAMLGLWIINWTSGSVSGVWGKVLSYISLVEHFDDFTKGILDTEHVIYYISFSFFCLFLAVKLVQSARWK